MGLDFDVREFCQNLRATKPPYECPVKDCGKIYKSFAGIQFHLFNFNHENPGSSLPTSHSPQEALTYADAQKIVELDFDGKLQRINIIDPIPLMDKEDFEKTYPYKNEGNRSPELFKPASIKATSKSVQKKSLKQFEIPQRKEEKPFSTTKLPEASFTVLEGYNLPDASERPKSYYRFIEKTPEELEDEVEYDMDEEDFTWLEFINKRRKFENLTEVNPESFELLMDRLEKESYFQMQNSGKDQGPSIDEDAVCCICMDGECQNSNVILFCDMCNLAVHQECYGVPYIPEGQWLCRRCLQSPSRAVDCALCPNRGGAFKQTDDGRWAHVVCALWIPEVCFANTVFLEPIDSIQNIPAARWKLTCYICKQRGAGACIQCHKANCYTAFHVTCAQQAGLHMKIDTVKDAPTNAPNVSVRKTAYCDSHTPPDSDSRPSVGDTSLGETIRKAQSKAAFREKMRKARKILAEKRSAAPIISIPTIPPERVQEIASAIHIQGKNKFIQRLIAYWTLKRQSRNGVPLLRRLQTTHPSRRPASQPPPETGEQPEPDDLLHQLRYFQRLRQDLERARLLCELIRKREKTKRELMKIREKELELKLYPLQYILRQLLEQLKEKDVNEFFAEPVDINEVPDYLEFIKQPMDFSTMQRKLDSLQYATLDQFEKDVNLIIHNCTIYNAQHTTYYKAAIKLKESAQVLLKQARKDLEDGHTTQQNREINSVEENRKTDSSVEGIDRYLADKYRETESLEQQLSKLEEFLRTAQQLPQSQVKAKRIRLLRTELAKVRRRLSLQAGGRAAATRSSSPSKVKYQQESSESSSSDSDCDFTPKPKPVVKQLKIDSFVTRATKNETDEKTSTVTTSSKNRLVAKVMKRNREASAANVKSHHQGSDAEDSTHSPELPVTPLKVNPSSSSTSPNLTGSPSGVNRRTAVLFTKKAAAAFKKPMESNSPPRRNIGRPRKASESSTPAPVATVPHSSNLFVTAAAADSAKRKKQKPGETEPNKLFTSSILQPSSLIGLGTATSLGNNVDLSNPLPNIESESFKIYRTNQGVDDDDSNHGSGSTCSSSSSGSSESESADESADPSSDESESSAGSPQSVPFNKPVHVNSVLLSCNDIPLQPLDLVWAKCRGYPWYPALIVDPMWPRTGYVHNGVPIPIPPNEVLALGTGVPHPAFLVLFFDAKRTWQWLPRNKLEPLGVDPDRDKAKLIESRKQTERKAVKKAYEEAILHQCRVAGQSGALSEDSSSSQSD